MKAKFKVGDKVRILDGSEIRNYFGSFTKSMRSYIGQIVTIERIKFDFDRGRIGYYTKGIYYLFDERGLELAKPETIVIYRKDNQVIALDKSNGKKAVARCNPEDSFDFKIGACIAFDRLIGNIKESPEPVKTPLNAKIVFTKGDSVFKTGHIYEIKDGKIIPNNEMILPKRIESFTDIDQVKDYFTATNKRKGEIGWSKETLQFIEVRED